MDHYEALGIDPSFDGDLRVVRNRLVKQYSEAGATPDEERMKAINLAYERLRDRPAPLARVVFRGGAVRLGSGAAGWAHAGRLRRHRRAGRADGQLPVHAHGR